MLTLNGAGAGACRAGEGTVSPGAAAAVELLALLGAWVVGTADGDAAPGTGAAVEGAGVAEGAALAQLVRASPARTRRETAADGSARRVGEGSMVLVVLRPAREDGGGDLVGEVCGRHAFGADGSREVSGVDVKDAGVLQEHD